MLVNTQCIIYYLTVCSLKRDVKLHTQKRFKSTCLFLCAWHLVCSINNGTQTKPMTVCWDAAQCSLSLRRLKTVCWAAHLKQEGLAAWENCIIRTCTICRVHHMVIQYYVKEAEVGGTCCTLGRHAKYFGEEKAVVRHGTERRTRLKWILHVMY
jgi:hypothetical protein